ncbi:uncharacterized protein DS421_19g657290 [Arachis hypogaea]|uniref:Uncharacterized protein n=1 Tax=Arachis hypogaea TaxID=3818 RepID=A0A6B9VCG2_ARAHY|nr:uncharacterized protein DS421_19g657290 [Arachis hypogaea]
MDAEATVVLEVLVTKAVEDTDHKDDKIKETNGDLPQVEIEGKKEEEENSFNGEFIKVEK